MPAWLAPALIAGGEAASGYFAGRESGKRGKEREAIRRSIMRMIQELKNRPTAGILDPQGQELFVRQKMQQMQPQMSGMAQKIASRFGLNQPSSQRMLAGTMLSTEMGTRTGLGREMAGREFQSEENLRRILAQLISSQPS